MLFPSTSTAPFFRRDAAGNLDVLPLRGQGLTRKVCSSAFLTAAPWIEDANHYADGDTLTILDARKRQHEIRLADIDAPETKQPIGTRSKQSLSDLCSGKTQRPKIRA
jgi:endonuclease YncB( thermonuclease family)